MTIVEFLEARIAEDEQSARWTMQPQGEDYDEAAFGESRWKGRKADWTQVWNGAVDTGDDIQHIGDDTVSSFMVDFDPARVLREVAAKRAIIKAYIEASDRANAYDYHESLLNGESNGLELSVELLASAYADHSDYQASWG